MQCSACFDKTHKEVIDPLLFPQVDEVRQKSKRNPARGKRRASNDHVVHPWHGKIS